MIVLAKLNIGVFKKAVGLLLYRLLCSLKEDMKEPARHNLK